MHKKHRNKCIVSSLWHIAPFKLWKTTHKNNTLTLTRLPYDRTSDNRSLFCDLFPLGKLPKICKNWYHLDSMTTVLSQQQLQLKKDNWCIKSSAKYTQRSVQYWPKQIKYGTDYIPFAQSWFQNNSLSPYFTLEGKEAQTIRFSTLWRTAPTNGPTDDQPFLSHCNTVPFIHFRTKKTTVTAKPSHSLKITIHTSFS